jgi:hypothetical protein
MTAEKEREVRLRKWKHDFSVGVSLLASRLWTGSCHTFL